MKRSLLSHKVKHSQDKDHTNDIRLLMDPVQTDSVLSPEEDYSLLLVDHEARVTLSRKIYDMCHKVSNICTIIVRN